ncbi:YdeI/OmpD-associated family protein [uncultured Roseobacter sp.]|uniref:YdeI/OmpD-associated family protein n=1 Tax=uncultured Roseobacter sp. TaxID=114847 RepID=UPI002604C9D5|nr:YdeI/OmpD-associated family protein [uncultured Roseobacter sp.]
MSDWISFDAVITPMEWGKNTYTVLRLPDDVAAALQARGARRVEGELNDHPVNLALTKSPAIDGVFLYTGKALLRETGLEPGEVFEARLRPASPDEVEVPEDVMAALRGAGRAAEWAALTPGKQRGMLHHVTAAKRPETRAKRIAGLVDGL